MLDRRARSQDFGAHGSPLVLIFPFHLLFDEAKVFGVKVLKDSLRSKSLVPAGLDDGPSLRDFLYLATGPARRGPLMLGKGRGRTSYVSLVLRQPWWDRDAILCDPARPVQMVDRSTGGCLITRLFCLERFGDVVSSRPPPRPVGYPDRRTCSRCLVLPKVIVCCIRVRVSMLGPISALLIGFGACLTRRPWCRVTRYRTLLQTNVGRPVVWVIKYRISGGSQRYADAHERKIWWRPFLAAPCDRLQGRNYQRAIQDREICKRYDDACYARLIRFRGREV